MKEYRIRTEPGLFPRLFDLCLGRKSSRRGDEGGRDPFENLVDQYDGERDEDDSLPLLPVERDDLEQAREERHVEDHEVESHREADCPDEVRVGPRRQGQEGLVFGERVESLPRVRSTSELFPWKR